jgi:hypothetical protein
VPLLNDRYAGDHALVAEVDRFPRDKAPLFIMDDCTPLGGSWFLFHLQQPARLLRNPTHLLREDVPDESYVLMRRCTAEKAAQFAYISLVKESACSKDEQGQEAFRMGLYHVTVLPHLARVSPVPLSPMQATGRSFGPFLTSEPGLRQLTAAPATETLPGVGFMPPGLLTPGSDPARQ